MSTRKGGWFTCLQVSVFIALVVVTAPAAQETTRGVRYERLVIRGGMLVDGLGSPMRGPVDIVVEGGTVVNIIPVDAVSLGGYDPGFTRPTGDRVIDAEGMYIVPGFVDMHAHIPEGRVVPAGEWGRSFAYQLWLAHGVTTLRDVGSGAGLDVLVEEARRSDANEITAPRIIPYAGWRGLGRPDQKNITPEEVRANVQKLHQDGAKGIKVFGPTYTDVLTALCDEARKLGMGVAIHIAVGQVDGAIAARAGVTTIEHWYGIPDAAIPGVQSFPGDYNYLDELARFRYAGKLWQEADPVLLEQVMDTLLEEGTTLVPTFVAYEPNRDLVRAQNLPFYKKYALPIQLEYWKPNLAHHGSYHYAWTSGDEASWRENFQIWMRFVREFWERGGQLALSPDAGGSFGLYGFNNVREMELYQEAGLDPVDIIEVASTGAARVLGLDELAKGVRFGSPADLVVVDGNPLHDLKVFYGTGITKLGETGELQSGGGIHYTIKDGIVFDARALLENVASMVREAGPTTSH